LELAPAVECESIAHLEKFFQDVVDKGGEGIILRDPYATLEPGRSAGYLKHKVGCNVAHEIILDPLQ